MFRFREVGRRFEGLDRLEEERNLNQRVTLANCRLAKLAAKWAADHPEVYNLDRSIVKVAAEN